MMIGTLAGAVGSGCIAAYRSVQCFGLFFRSTIF